nr:winged helix DNA-binding domain-containing protein [Erysipelotrichaceae bacterium]
MEKIIIDKKTARRFLLMKHGLFGDYRFEKKEGAYQYIRQTGCIQYDPVDSVGKNAELTLQSRVRRFRKKDLYDLLYKDRRLFDYFDKEIAIIPTEDWPYFRSYRDLCARNAAQFEGLRELEDFTLDYIERHGPVSSSTLPVKGDIYWHSSLHWSGNWEGKSKASRSVLEQLYTTGDLIVHHKEGSRKFYDLSSKYIAEQILQAADPLPDLYEHIRWRVLRRINAVGMLSNRNSDAFLGIRGMTTEIRNSVFADLIENKEIIPLQIGIGKAIFY